MGLMSTFPAGMRIERVFRRGKRVIIDFGGTWYLDCHNAMTGYWDWEHDPWTFDYVEGPRESSETDVRVKLHFEEGLSLRFHDSRMFGRISAVREVPGVGPELMETPNMMPGAPIITIRQFAEWVLSERRPIKLALMDQSRMAGIGNIYANEGCHLAGIDPHVAGMDLRPGQVPILLEALRCVVSHSIPTVQYQWLKVYRRDLCGSCDGSVTRTEIAKRATFMCKRCQGEP